MKPIKNIYHETWLHLKHQSTAYKHLDEGKGKKLQAIAEFS
jgi:hypothetical protein